MKKQITRKKVKYWYSTIIEVGYCGLHNLLSLEYPYYYTAGVYGWNADIYHIDNDTCIVTGYRPFGNIQPTYKILERYDLIAETIKRNKKASYQETKDALRDLIKEFVEEVK